MTESTPGRCRACPFIFPDLRDYTNREAELYVLQNSPQLVEYSDAADIEARIDQLKPEVEALSQRLESLQALTVGCRGVKLAQIILDGEHLESYECQSPLKHEAPND